jgi:hypothetical protein
MQLFCLNDRLAKSLLFLKFVGNVRMENAPQTNAFAQEHSGYSRCTKQANHSDGTMMSWLIAPLEQVDLP